MALVMLSLVSVTGCEPTTQTTSPPISSSTNAVQPPNASVTTDVPTSSFTPEQAIAKVNNIEGTVFPAKPESNKGTIYEINLGKKNPIPGTLQTKIKESGPNSYLVTFVESWSSTAFQVSSQHATGEHFWTYLVSPTSSKIVTQGGDYPPQAAK
jgi:hypothetical protein